MLPAGIALFAGLDAALVLIGLPAPIDGSRLPEVHGVLLVLGFVGTLISLERATALRRWYGYAAPMLLGLGGLAQATSGSRSPEPYCCSVDLTRSRNTTPSCTPSSSATPSR